MGNLVTKLMTDRVPAKLCAAAAMLVAILAALPGGRDRQYRRVERRAAAAKAPQGSVVLMPGGNGAIGAGPGGTSADCRTTSWCARVMPIWRAVCGPGGRRQHGSRQRGELYGCDQAAVTVIATSRGTIRAAEGIARGARPDKLVLTSAC